MSARSLDDRGIVAQSVRSGRILLRHDSCLIELIIPDEPGIRMHPHEDELHLRHLERTCAALDGLSCVLLETQQELQAKIGRLGQSLRSFQTQQQRRLSERERTVNRQTTLLEALPAAMAVLDAADRVVQANAAARRLLGTPLYGLTWMQIQ
jgi:PAS domain-containing protein